MDSPAGLITGYSDISFQLGYDGDMRFDQNPYQFVGDKHPAVPLLALFMLGLKQQTLDMMEAQQPTPDGAPEPQDFTSSRWNLHLVRGYSRGNGEAKQQQKGEATARDLWVKTYNIIFSVSKSQRFWLVFTRVPAQTRFLVTLDDSESMVWTPVGFGSNCFP